MIRKTVVVILALVLVAGLFVFWRFFLSNTSFDEKAKYLYVHTGKASRDDVMKTLHDSGFVNNPGSFEFVADRMGVWDEIQPGRYSINNGMSLYQLAKKLKNASQDPVNLVITKLRTKEQLAGIIGRKFETDSAQMIRFLTNSDSLRKYSLDSNTVMTAVFPNTYTYFWNSAPSTIFSKLNREKERVWTDERTKLAAGQGLTPDQAYILASIIEEETNVTEEMGNMASVYMNRLKKGMPLAADPTVKFALKDFSLRRIYEKHLMTESPYNTYRNKGLPPGPICTPRLSTLDQVLNAPQTDYIFFVAKSDFSKRHVFTSSYQEHLRYARQYHLALDSLLKQRQDSGKLQTANAP
jgi:UPF0755 protein